MSYPLKIPVISSEDTCHILWRHLSCPLKTPVISSEDTCHILWRYVSYHSSPMRSRVQRREWHPEGNSQPHNTQPHTLYTCVKWKEGWRDVFGPRLRQDAGHLATRKIATLVCDRRHRSTCGLASLCPARDSVLPVVYILVCVSALLCACGWLCVRVSVWVCVYKYAM